MVWLDNSVHSSFLEKHSQRDLAQAIAVPLALLEGSETLTLPHRWPLQSSAPSSVQSERGTERLLCCASVKLHHGLLCGFGGLPIADSNVLHGRADGLVAQALPYQREVDVRGDQVAGEG